MKSAVALSACISLIIFGLTTLCFGFRLQAGEAVSETVASDNLSIDLTDWRLVWEDDFDYPDEELDVDWQSKNGPCRHILCSRWRENVVVKDGVLHLVNRKESRGGQDWTSGSIWTKRKFKYGYFECRYRYAEASGTNNSFWLMSPRKDPEEGKRFEIDINEGHYPNEINTNIHNWSDFTVRENGSRRHPTSHKGFAFGTRVGHSLPFEIPIVTDKLRFSSTTIPHAHIRELRIYEPSTHYPNALSKASHPTANALVNHARNSKVIVTSSRSHRNQTTVNEAVDGTLRTSWVARGNEEKWIELRWPDPVTIGCIQIVNGWKRKGVWTDYGRLTNFKIQVADGSKWKEVAEIDAKDIADFGANFHTYGLLWDKDELVFYHDRKELRRVPNTFCHSESPIYLSEAIINWGGEITDQIDGTSMKVDWVRYYQK